jgi:hypothetical protein
MRQSRHGGRGPWPLECITGQKVRWRKCDITGDGYRSDLVERRFRPPSRRYAQIVSATNGFDDR